MGPHGDGAWQLAPPAGRGNETWRPVQELDRGTGTQEVGTPAEKVKEDSWP